MQCVLSKAVIVAALLLLVTYVGYFARADANQDTPCTLHKKAFVKLLADYRELVTKQGVKITQEELDPKEREIFLNVLEVLKACGFADLPK